MKYCHLYVDHKTNEIKNDTNRWRVRRRRLVPKLLIKIIKTNLNCIHIKNTLPLITSESVSLSKSASWDTLSLRFSRQAFPEENS